MDHNNKNDSCQFNTERHTKLDDEQLQMRVFSPLWKGNFKIIQQSLTILRQYYSAVNDPLGNLLQMESIRRHIRIVQGELSKCYW